MKKAVWVVLAIVVLVVVGMYIWTAPRKADKPVKLNEDYKTFAEVQEFWPADLYVEKDGIIQVLKASNNDVEQATVSFLSKRSITELKPLYVGFGDTHNLPKLTSEVKEGGVAVLIMSNADNSESLQVNLILGPDTTQVVVVYTKAK